MLFPQIKVCCQMQASYNGQCSGWHGEIKAGGKAKGGWSSIMCMSGKCNKHWYHYNLINSTI